MKKLITLVSCPDKMGLISWITACIARAGGNIIYLNEWVDGEHLPATFLIRIVSIHPKDFGVKKEERLKTQIMSHISGTVRIYDTVKVPRVALLGTFERHCLDEVVMAHRRNELIFKPTFIGSNYLDLKKVVENEYRWEFKHFFKVGIAGQDEQERCMLKALKDEQVDILVLAKFMQILSEEFIRKFPMIVNTHHSGLPAFTGAKPYKQAYERGVKFTGASTHFVTKILDNGPIIMQMNHNVERCSSEEMKKRGRKLERLVTVETLAALLEHRVIRYGNKTHVFPN